MSHLHKTQNDCSCFTGAFSLEGNEEPMLLVCCSISVFNTQKKNEQGDGTLWLLMGQV
jgi:hypothetical protein